MSIIYSSAYYRFRNKPVNNKSEHKKYRFKGCCANMTFLRCKKRLKNVLLGFVVLFVVFTSQSYYKALQTLRSTQPKSSSTHLWQEESHINSPSNEICELTEIELDFSLWKNETQKAVHPKCDAGHFLTIQSDGSVRFADGIKSCSYRVVKWKEDDKFRMGRDTYLNDGDKLDVNEEFFHFRCKRKNQRFEEKNVEGILSSKYMSNKI